MSAVNRRYYLAALGAGTVASVSGCLSGGDDDGSEPEPQDGEWILRATIQNQDDEPRDWRVESRSQDRNSVASGRATVPAGGEWELELRGEFVDEEREVYVEAGEQSLSETWRPADCGRLVAAITIGESTLSIDTECREE